MRRMRLTEVQITTLELLVAADPAILAALPGFNRSVVDKALAAAVSILESTGPAGPAGSPPEVPDDFTTTPTTDDPEPPKRSKKKGARRKRGLDAARRIEHSLEWVRRARDHARAATHIQRKSTRFQLKRLEKFLVGAQRELIRDGVSRDGAVYLDDLLSQLERRLKRFTKSEPKRKALIKIRRRALRARRSISARFE